MHSTRCIPRLASQASVGLPFFIARRSQRTPISILPNYTQQARAIARTGLLCRGSSLLRVCGVCRFCVALTGES